MGFLKSLFSRTPKKALEPSKSRAQVKHSIAGKRKSAASPANPARTKDAKTCGQAGQNKAAPKKRMASKAG